MDPNASPHAGTNVQSMPTSQVPVPPMAGSSVSIGQETAPASQQISEGDQLTNSWISRVKSTIVATKDDPYDQAAQIAQLRAEYVKARFGKETTSDKVQL